MDTAAVAPGRERLGGLFAGASGDTLLVAGGTNFLDKPPWEGGTKFWYDTIYALSPGQSVVADVGKLPRTAGLRRLDRDGSRLAVRRRRRRRRPLRRSLPAAMAGGSLHGRPAAAVAHAVCLSLRSAGWAASSTWRAVSDNPAATSALRTFWAMDLAAPKPELAGVGTVAGAGTDSGRGRRPGRSVLLVQRCGAATRCRRRPRPTLSVRRLPFHARPRLADRRRPASSRRCGPFARDGHRAVAPVGLQRGRWHQGGLDARRTRIPAFQRPSWPITRSPTLGYRWARRPRRM